MKNLTFVIFNWFVNLTSHHKIATIMTNGSTLSAKSTNNAGATTIPSISLDDVHSCDPIFFPQQKDDKADGSDESQITFLEACQLAAESHRPLHLSQGITDLSETIVLRGRQHLSIVGRISSSSTSFSPSSCEISEGEHDLSPPSGRIKIAGKIHSLFLLNNNSRLKLRDLELVHQDDDGEDCRKVGAAVNLRYKSKAWLERCTVTSHGGFCCWAVQKSSMDLEGCHLEAPLRSAVVCFGQAKFEGRSSTITNVGVHGVCARGECHIRMVDSSIVDSAVRGLYAYANASVCLEGCTIRGTARPDMAAIEVSSAEAEMSTIDNDGETTKGKTNKKKNVVIQKASSLIMNECNVIDNAGVGVRIRGGVRHNLSSQNDDKQNNHFARNLGGNEVDFRASSAEGNDEKRDSQIIGSNRNDSNEVQKNQSNEKLQRDPSGSSFRKGDWWCLGCVPESVVQGSRDSCPRCRSRRSDGKFLLSEEVMKLNRSGGIWIASTPDTKIPVVVQSEKAEDKIEVIASPAEVSPRWWFDGDDAGWLPYDTESNQKLESAFQSLRCIARDPSKDVEGEEVNQEKYKQTSNSKIVLLSGGRYSVNMERMEQINTDSHFLRLVKRRDN
jgi:hypothetical protein